MSDLLVGKVRVGQRGDTGLIRPLIDQPPTQLGACHLLAARQDERGVAKIDERDLTAVLDTPAMSKPGWQTRLTPVGHFRARDLRHHRCIVTRNHVQGIWVAGPHGRDEVAPGRGPSDHTTSSRSSWASASCRSYHAASGPSMRGGSIVTRE